MTITEGDQAFGSRTDEELEYAFLNDYAQFAARISTDAIITLVDEAACEDDHPRQKRLCTAAFQILCIAFEDFAILLRAILARKAGTFLHVSISGGGQTQGTTKLPRRLKQHATASGLLIELGLASITIERLNQIGYDATADELDDAFSDFGPSLQNLAGYMEDHNELKNRLKHGKAILGIEFDLAITDDIAHLTFNGGATMQKTDVSLEQLRVAVILVAKMLKISLDLLAFAVIHYHPEHGEEYAYMVRDIMKEVSANVKALGITSRGLTDLQFSE